MASIEDVAKHANVSITTVSRYLNKHPYISEKTKLKIQKAMQELAYTPNTVAQQLRGKKTKLIGVIISNLTNQFFTTIVNAIEKEIYKNGYQAIILQTYENKERELAYLSMLESKQLDGIIMTSMDNEWTIVNRFVNNNIVLCNRYIGVGDVPNIKIDEYEATEKGIDYLLTKGHQFIAYCTGASSLKGDQRYKGFIAAHKKHNVMFKNKLNKTFFANVITSDDGRKVAKQIMSLTDRPTAVFANGDTVAAGIIAQILDLGYKVPQDLAVLGFDNQPISTLMHPKITTISQPIEEMGTFAAKMLLAKLSGEEVPVVPKMETFLIKRDTV